jgi:hypothetical protein
MNHRLLDAKAISAVVLTGMTLCEILVLPGYEGLWGRAIKVILKDNRCDTGENIINQVIK